ncbi:MAG: Sua5/YciO/YrdC/YwlC family protein, partial [Flavobacteriaceae bacterium]
ELRKRKLRPTKPFAVLYPSLKRVKVDFQVSKEEEDALCGKEAPIVILGHPKSPLIATHAIAPHLEQIGVMLPSSALLELLMAVLGRPIVATSGNLHGSPIIAEQKRAQRQLQKVADYFLHHDLAIQFPQDDSVVKLVGSQSIVLRRSRGMAPNCLNAPLVTQGVLAMGAHLKSTFAYVPNAHTYVSPYFGNLDSYASLRRYENAIEQYVQLFNCKPQTILVDAHPNYESHVLGRTLAEKWKVKVAEIQHHKAHFASVLGEHHLHDTPEKILGVVWDGTGMGTDRTVWGGEFFVYQHGQMSRVSHFTPYNWLANDTMAKEPKLSLLSLLAREHHEGIRAKFNASQWRIYQIIGANNTLKTSSVGRLFDAAASALDLCDTNTFEGEAAMILEQAATSYQGDDLLDFLEGEGISATIPSHGIINNLFKAIKKGVAKDRLAASFIHTLAKSMVAIAQREGVKIVACSGGVFQNAYLRKQLGGLAQEAQLTILYNKELSPNDENISFGQLMYHEYIINN